MNQLPLRLAVATALLTTLGAAYWAMTPKVNRIQAARMTVTPTEAIVVSPARPPAAPQAANGKTCVQSLLTEYDQLFVTNLNGAVNKDLMTRRDTAQRELVAKLSALGSGGARLIGESFKSTDNVRDRLLLAQALGQLNDRETVSTLKELLTSQTDPYVRQQLIIALGHRSEPSVIEPLARMLTAGKPEFVQFAAVQALAGRADALPVLQGAIQADYNRTVRLEAIRAVGLIANNDAKTTLIDLARQSAVEPFIRETAIEELRRSFGPAALGTLQSLSKDAEPAIRESASRALAMLQLRQ